MNLGLCVLYWVNLFSGVFLMCSGQEKITIHSWENELKQNHLIIIGVTQFFGGGGGSPII